MIFIFYIIWARSALASHSAGSDRKRVVLWSYMRREWNLIGFHSRVIPSFSLLSPLQPFWDLAKVPLLLTKLRVLLAILADDWPKLCQFKGICFNIGSTTTNNWQNNEGYSQIKTKETLSTFIAAAHYGSLSKRRQFEKSYSNNLKLHLSEIKLIELQLLFLAFFTRNHIWDDRVDFIYGYVYSELIFYLWMCLFVPTN